MTLPNYEPVIKEALSQFRTIGNKREDLIQDCWVALLQNPDKDPLTTCRRTIMRGLKPPERGHRQDPKIYSLSDPKIYARAVKGTLQNNVEKKLQDAVLELPEEEYKVLWNLFLEGRTQKETADKLGLTRRQVRIRKDRGINMLKSYFEVME